jgi:hypothetical protein
MTGPGTHRITRNSKKSGIPLSKLRTSDVVKTVVDNPRRLEELLSMLHDQDLRVRGRAAATVARLADSHPGRLPRLIPRLRETVDDDSAYVRWHLVYALGKLGFRYPEQVYVFLNDIIGCLDDTNRIVRIMACNALGQIEAGKPGTVQGFFRNLGKVIPPAVVRFLRNTENGCHENDESRPATPDK